MNDAPLVIPFGDPTCRDVSLSGGKGASLAVMTAAGMPVPPGFVVTSAAFFAAVNKTDLQTLAKKHDLEEIRGYVERALPPLELIAQQISLLTEPVAVRSSACAEDSATASYAGQQETFLNVRGFDDIIKYIVECWLSFFSDRAVFYRQERGSLEDIGMAVVVQQMVDSQKSGVLFTVDPVQGRRDRMIVEAALGLGEAVVSGSVTPDHYVLDLSGEVKRRKVVNDPVLDDHELKMLAELARQVVEIYGRPQDIEWAFDGDDSLFLLQSRPITTI